MVKNLIDFFITVGLFLPQFLGLVVGLLQLLQFEPYTTNTGFIRSLIGELGIEGILKTPELWQSAGFADENLVLGQEARKRGVETWNWCVCQWRLQIMKDISVLSSKVSFFLSSCCEKGEKRLQLHLLCLDNNLFENDSKKAFKPSRPGKNSDFLYL